MIDLILVCIIFVAIAVSLGIVFCYSPYDRLKWAFNFRADCLAAPLMVAGCLMLLFAILFRG